MVFYRRLYPKRFEVLALVGVLACSRGKRDESEHRIMPEEHVEATEAAFLMTRESCPAQLLEFHRGDWSILVGPERLVC